MRKILIIFLIFCVALISAFFVVDWLNRGNEEIPASVSKNNFEQLPEISIGQAILKVESARTQEEKSLGLSGRDFLPENQGMLFIYDKPDFYSFWMKDMRFPIDIIWIGENLAVSDIIENIQPKSFPKTFKSKTPVQYVLEANAGWVKNNGIKTGMAVILPSDIISQENMLPEIQIDIEEEAGNGEEMILFNVPFAPQAPFGNWKDERQEDGCEEASALMAMAWVSGNDLTLEDAEKEIIAISDWEFEKYGEFHDTSAEDTVERIFKGYFNYQNAEVKYNINIEDIKKELRGGNLVIVPVNGQRLGNPFYNPPGPLRHNILIIGYDPQKKEFVTNDSGTKRGAGLRYSESVLENAMRDYSTGFHKPIAEEIKSMIVVKK